MFYKKLKLPCRLLRDVSYGSVYDVTSACELELVASGQLMPDIDLERGALAHIHVSAVAVNQRRAKFDVPAFHRNYQASIYTERACVVQAAVLTTAS